MRHLGALRGTGLLEGDGTPIGPVQYELDGYLVRRDEIVASGEIHMDATLLAEAFGRRALVLRSDDGLALALRFSGKRLAAGSTIAHVDVREGLPAEKDWRRSG